MFLKKVFFQKTNLEHPFERQRNFFKSKITKNGIGMLLILHQDIQGMRSNAPNDFQKYECKANHLQRLARVWNWKKLW